MGISTELYDYQIVDTIKDVETNYPEGLFVISDITDVGKEILSTYDELSKSDLNFPILDDFSDCKVGIAIYSDEDIDVFIKDNINSTIHLNEPDAKDLFMVADKCYHDTFKHSINDLLQRKNAQSKFNREP